eukprot:scaffold206880_cov32-Tisochrysis_lutea.AAC.2
MTKLKVVIAAGHMDTKTHHEGEDNEDEGCHTGKEEVAVGPVCFKRNGAITDPPRLRHEVDECPDA